VAKSLRDRILEALKKEALTEPELSERLSIPTDYHISRLLKLEEGELVEYDYETDKWRLKKR